MKKNNIIVVNMMRERIENAKKRREKALKEKTEEFEHTLVLANKKETESGYVSAAVIISTVINVGIAIALYLILK